MTLALKIGHCSLTGNYRENNEDAIGIKRFADATLCAVADGMGGHAAGEIASRRAIEVIHRELGKHLTPQAEVPEVLRQAVIQANKEILAMGELDTDLKHMGTTIALGVWHCPQQLVLAHVGDSRVYLIRDGRIQRLTVDHNLLEAMIEAGALTREEAEHFQGKNYLMHYLGSPETSERGPDIRILDVAAGDRYLLCSDGLVAKVPDEGLLRCSETVAEVQQCAEALGRLALDAGSRDNVSCIVVEVVRGEGR